MDLARSASSAGAFISIILGSILGAPLGSAILGSVLGAVLSVLGSPAAATPTRPTDVNNAIATLESLIMFILLFERADYTEPRDRLKHRTRRTRRCARARGCCVRHDGGYARFTRSRVF